jgi:hypothetical protein
LTKTEHKPEGVYLTTRCAHCQPEVNKSKHFVMTWVTRLLYPDLTMSPVRKNNNNQNQNSILAERVVVEQVKTQNQRNLSENLEDNETFEDTIVKVEVYESEREITRALQDYVRGTDEEKRLVQKIDLRLLPVLGVMYALQSIDRTGMVSYSTNYIKIQRLTLRSTAQRSPPESGSTTKRAPRTAR